MKKQINLPIRANLLRCTLIMLPLLAVCVIPFALAQRTYRGKPDERYSSRPPSRVVNPTGLASTLTPATPDCEVLIDERFDDIRNLPGWVLMNHSEPLGASDWFQGNDEVFPAFDGDPTAYIAVNFNNGGDLATISNWLLTPEISLQDGSTLTFYTRTIVDSAYPDRLQVRMSTNDAKR